ncbi:MAG: hypothetical protein P8Z50_02375 [candidate division WOR-3 bacterium]
MSLTQEEWRNADLYKGFEKPMTADEIREQWEYELKRLIWNAKKLSERLHKETTKKYDSYMRQKDKSKNIPHPPLTRSADAWIIEELLNYISKHEVEKFTNIELKIKEER